MDGGGEMFGTLESELAKSRAESLRADGGLRSVRSPGRLRRALGYWFVGTGERLLGECHDTHAIRIGGGA